MVRVTITLLSALVALAALAQTTSGIAGPANNDYTMTVIPLDDVRAINNADVIVGTVGTRAVAYSQNQVIPLPVPAGYAWTQAVDISDTGHIIGNGSIDGHVRGLFWDSLTAAPIDMGYIGPPTTQITPNTVNSAGMVVGSFVDLGQSGSTSHSFRWSRDSGMTQIDPANVASNSADDISDTGFIAGNALQPAVPYGFTNEAVRWYPNNNYGFGFGTPSYAHRVLANGNIIGGNTLSNLNNIPMQLVHASPVIVEQMSANGRLVGEGFGPLGGSSLDFTFPFTMPTPSPSNSIPSYLPIPYFNYGYAIDVSACGTIVGSIVDGSDGSSQSVVWEHPTCDNPPNAIVPNLSGQTLTTAMDTLVRAALFSGAVTYVNGKCDSVGAVVSQSPGGGSSVKVASAIDTTIPSYCVVPNLYQLTSSAASAALRQAGLTLGSITTVIDNSCDYHNTVKSQSVAANTILYGTTSVTITIAHKDPKYLCP